MQRQPFTRDKPFSLVLLDTVINITLGTRLTVHVQVVDNNLKFSYLQTMPKILFHSSHMLSMSNSGETPLTALHKNYLFSNKHETRISKR